jgi:hypothetical protein
MRPGTSSPILVYPRRHRYGVVAGYASFALALSAVLGATVFLNVGGRTAEGPLSPICDTWDATAASALAGLISDRSDAAVRQLNDGLFRLRRARRNCRAGWVNLACQDYQSLLRSTLSERHRHELASSTKCAAGLQAAWHYHAKRASRNELRHPH